MINRRRLMLVTAGALTAGPLRHVRAQGQVTPAPLDSATILVGFPAGGGADTVARLLAEKMRGTYARTVIVENKAGAGARIAAEALKYSAPDGRTLLLAPAGVFTLYPHVFQHLSYDPIADFAPVSTIYAVEFGLCVGPAVPASVTTLKGFLAWAKATPDQANFGSPGNGLVPHLLGALLSKLSGVELRHIAYKGTAPALLDCLGGQISAVSNSIGPMLPYISSGKLRLLATAGAQRSTYSPSVPTYTELGFPQLQSSEWIGFVVPSRTPESIVQGAATAVSAATKTPEFIAAIKQIGAEPSSMTPEQLRQAMIRETTQWGALVKQTGFTPEA